METSVVFLEPQRSLRRFTLPLSLIQDSLKCACLIFKSNFTTVGISLRKHLKFNLPSKGFAGSVKKSIISERTFFKHVQKVFAESKSFSRQCLSNQLYHMDKMECKTKCKFKAHFTPKKSTFVFTFACKKNFGFDHTKYQYQMKVETHN